MNAFQLELEQSVKEEIADLCDIETDEDINDRLHKQMCEYNGLCPKCESQLKLETYGEYDNTLFSWECPTC
jgi:hypothetical protein